MTKSYDRQIEEILNHRVVRRRGVPPSTQYLIKWKGLPESEATWEAQEDLWQFENQLHHYKDTLVTRASLNQVGENVTTHES